VPIPSHLPALQTATHDVTQRYGSPFLIQPRLGQGAFRVAVTEAYQRACAVTQEHSLPALEAAHIKPFAQDGPHDIQNGILLRADFHRLFEQGYLTVNTEHYLEVSKRLRLDYDNGHTYYPLDGKKISIPTAALQQPGMEYLQWHNENVFLA
jgi:putative restriction endonuclease